MKMAKLRLLKQSLLVIVGCVLTIVTVKLPFKTAIHQCVPVLIDTTESRPHRGNLFSNTATTVEPVDTSPNLSSKLLDSRHQPREIPKVEIFQNSNNNGSRRNLFECCSSFLRNSSDLEPRCSRVIYNRIPKCGSRTLLNIIAKLSVMWHFTFVKPDPPPSRGNYYEKDELQPFMKNITQHTVPLVYSQHVHYINFTSIEKPVYINLIRDPVERMISHYYYNIFGSQNQPNELHNKKVESLDRCVEKGHSQCNMNAILPYFCGHNPKCRKRDNYALQRAKKIAEEDFLVIGVTEDYRNFIEALEFLLPTYFSNATEVFKSSSATSYNNTRTVFKASVKPETREKLRKKLELEYEFYYFVKQRFYKQLLEVRRARANLKSEGKISNGSKNTNIL